MMTSSSSSATTTPDPAPPLGSAPATAASPSATLRRLRLPSPPGESSSAGAGGAAAASSAAAMKRKPLGCSSLSSSVCVSAILHLSACVVSSTSSTTPGPSLTGRLSSGLSPCNSPSSPPPSSSSSVNEPSRLGLAGDAAGEELHACEGAPRLAPPPLDGVELAVEWRGGTCRLAPPPESTPARLSASACRADSRNRTAPELTEPLISLPCRESEERKERRLGDESPECREPREARASPRPKATACPVEAERRRL
mmetsp:Transcript_33975/g.103946  ORF Transcript_33975/g.103946 Transcript_33975/m.103946 type:complete len:255 (-) Transcript_33975:553-1317(-)